MNLFKPFWNRSWWSPRGMYDNLRTIGNHIKWGRQRLTHGYCDADVWNFDSYLAEVIPAGLRKLAIHGMSYPGSTEFPTFETWAEYLNDTADMIEWGSKDPDEVNENPFPVGTPEYRDQYMKILNQQQDCLDQGFERLAHIFKTLWD